MTKQVALAMILALGLTWALAVDMPKNVSHRTGVPHHTTQEVRDWATIDANKDGLIEPGEMEKYLQAQWAKNKTVAEKK